MFYGLARPAFGVGVPWDVIVRVRACVLFGQRIAFQEKYVNCFFGVEDVFEVWSGGLRRFWCYFSGNRLSSMFVIRLAAPA